ncbi:MAG: hypothetical protein PHO56_04460 [Patescibacteria group bacterium]|nr:hypothetical protein [Patescibacteria group bacterium]
MPYIQDSLNKFSELEPEVILTVDGDEAVKNIEAVAQRNNIETGPLSMALIFLATDDLSMDKIAPYLEERLETSSATAQKITADFIDSVVNPLKKRLDFLNFNPGKTMTVEEEKNYLSEMFMKNLLSELKNHPIILDAINHQIFYILDKDLKFSGELVKMLLANEEILTSGTVLAGGKSLSGAIGNWLKNFIEVNGSSIFDSVALSRYLIGSKSAVKLSQPEKEKVKEILTIYRNLKFFPESMPDDTGEGWQILPFEIPAEEKLAQAKEKIESLPKQVAESKQAVVFSARHLAEEKEEEERKEKLEQLNKIMEKYPPNSLQRKAVEEEIKKTSRKL